MKAYFKVVYECMCHDTCEGQSSTAPMKVLSYLCVFCIHCSFSLFTVRLFSWLYEPFLHSLLNK